MAVTSNLMSGIDGLERAFRFTFPYQNITDIKVELVRTPTPSNNSGVTTKTTLDHTKFKLAPDAVTVTLSALDADTDFQEASGAPKNATNDYVVSGKVYRDTDSSQLAATFYPGSAIRSADLNNNFTQNLFVTQESEKDTEDNSTAVERLVGFTTDNGTTWVTTGGNTDASDDPKGLKYGIKTAEDAEDVAIDARDNYAVPAKTATDTYVHDGTNLQGGGPADGQPKGVKYTVDLVETYVADSNGLKGDGNSPNPQGVKYAVDKVNDWIINGDGTTVGSDGNTHQGVPYAVDLSEEALENSRTLTNGGTILPPTGNGGQNTAPYTTAIYIADNADQNASDAIEATNALVGKKDANGNWYVRGHGSGGTDSQGDASTEDGVGKALDDSAEALSTANTFRDGHAIPAKEATDALVGIYNTTTNQWETRGHDDSANGDPESGVGKALDDSAEALANSRNTATPPVSAIFIAEDAYDNAVRQSSDPNWSPSGGTESAIRIAEAAEVTSALAESIANTASANATAAQNAVANAELFTPYATISDIPDNNVSSITIVDQGEGYTSTPAVTIGVEWAVATAYSLNDEVFNGSNIYLVTTAGTSAAAPSNGPTGTGSSIADGSVTWEYKGPKATATAVVTDEKVTSITVTNKGNHYTGTPTVTIAAPPAATPPATASQATATAVMGPLDEEKAEVADSTGLTTFSPLTGIPAGFGLGDTGLTAKIKYTTSTTPATWQFISYYANDAEIRYWKKIVIENQREIDRDYSIGAANNAFGVGPVTIENNKTLTIPANSTYLVL